MSSTFRLKHPFFVTFTTEAGTREELISHLTFHTAVYEDDDEQAALPGYQDVEDMLSRLELGDDLEMDRALFAQMDLDYGLRSAYAAAEDRALAYLGAIEQRDQAQVFPIHMPTREERREASFRAVEEWLRDHPEEAQRDRKTALDAASSEAAK